MMATVTRRTLGLAGLAASLLLSSCERRLLLLDDASAPITISAEVAVQKVTRASSDPDFETYRTLNSVFINDESYLFIDNPLQGEPFPDFENGFVQYYHNGQTHECQEEFGGTPGESFYVFMPVAGTQSLRKGALVHSPNDNNYRIEAVHIPGVSTFDELSKRYKLEGRLYSGSVDADQSSLEKLKKNDLMLAHNLTSVSDIDLNRHIHLHFWHSMAMIVINLGIPDFDQVSGTGFDNSSNPITGEGCSLVDMILNFRVNYSTYTNSDQAIRVSLPGKEDQSREDVRMCYLGRERRDETLGGKTRSHHWYRFCALVPVQTKSEIGPDGFAAKLCRFSLYDPSKGKETSYTYRQDHSIMEQGQITILNLRLDQSQPDPLLVSSEVLPWTHAYTTEIECKEEN